MGAVRGYIYSVTVSATRPATDYTARVIPNYDSVAVPLEAAQILWQTREFEVTDVSLKPLDKAKTIQHTAKA